MGFALQVHQLNKKGLSDFEMDSLGKMCTGLELRIEVWHTLWHSLPDKALACRSPSSILLQALRSSGKSGISLDDMQRIKPWFANMMNSTGKSQ